MADHRVLHAQGGPAEGARGDRFGGDHPEARGAEFGASAVSQNRHGFPLNAKGVFSDPLNYQPNVVHHFEKHTRRRIIIIMLECDIYIYIFEAQGASSFVGDSRLYA